MRPFACSTRWLAITLSSDACITSISSGAEQFTGYSAQELVGRPLIQLLEDDSALELPRVLTIATEWGFWEGEMIHKVRGGRRLEARCTVSALAGKPDGADGYLLLSSLNKSLVLNAGESSAVTEIADTLRTYAHDLNNPLAIMMGFTQLLVLNENCQSQMRHDLDKLYAELKRVIQLVDQLHGYARSLYQKPQSEQESAIRHA